MIEKLPSSHTYVLLGDAYMKIQEVSARCVSSVSFGQYNNQLKFGFKMLVLNVIEVFENNKNNKKADCADCALAVQF